MDGAGRMRTMSSRAAGGGRRAAGGGGCRNARHSFRGTLHSPDELVGAGAGCGLVMRLRTPPSRRYASRCVPISWGGDRQGPSHRLLPACGEGDRRAACAGVEGLRTPHDAGSPPCSA